jgi:hypothetical protein
MSVYRTTEDDLLRALRERAESLLEAEDPDMLTYPLPSPDDMAAAESDLGFPLPPLLRSIYLVANGGIGPGYGLYPIGEGAGSLAAEYRHFVDRGLFTWRHADAVPPDSERHPWPERLLPLCNWEGATWSCLDCRSNDGPIVTLCNGYSAVSTGHSLRSWLSRWLAGVALIDEMFEPGASHTAMNPFTKQPLVVKGRGNPKGRTWP